MFPEISNVPNKQLFYTSKRCSEFYYKADQYVSTTYIECLKSTWRNIFRSLTKRADTHKLFDIHVLNIVLFVKPTYN